MLPNQLPHTVEKIDGSREVIALPQRLTISQLYQFVHKLAAIDGLGLVTLVAGKNAEWIDSLTPKSFGELHRKIIDLNFPNAIEVAMGDPRLAHLMLPVIQEAQVATILAPLIGMTLENLSTAQPSQASAEATRGESLNSPLSN
jgi:hypothetical protein